MANGYQTNILTNSYREIQVCSLSIIGKFGGCWQMPTQKIVLGSILCRHNREIWAKCANIWPVMATCCQHVGNFLSQENEPSTQLIDETS
jgi:hypothetical protein